MTPIERQEALIRVFGVVHAYEDELFVVSPNRLGFGFEGSPLTGADAAQWDAMNGLLKLNFPPGAALQVSLWLSPDIEDVMWRYTSMRDKKASHPFLKAFTEQRLAFLRRLTRETNRATGAKLRKPRLIITVTVPVGSKAPSPDALREIRELRMTMIAQFKAIKVHMEAITSRSYVRMMGTMLNHGEDAVWRRNAISEYDEGRLLCNQLLDADTKIEVGERTLSLGKHAKVRVLHPKTFPDFVRQGMAFQYIGDLLKGQKTVREAVLITFNLLYGDQAGVKSKMQTEYAWNQKQSEGPLARFIPDWARQRDSQKIAIEALEQGDRLVQGKIGMAVFAPTEDRVVQASTEAVERMGGAGFHMMEDRFAVLPMFCSLLPFAAEKDIQQGLQRYCSMTTRHVAPLMPMFSSWSGTGTPLLTLFGRDDGLMTFSPYDTDSNMNFVIAAQSGMGKSFLSNELIMNFLSIGGRAWVIDKGYSYKPLAELLGGTYIEFATDNNLCLNPFEIVKSWEEESDILAALVTIMAAPKSGFTDFQLPGVKRVMGTLWEEKGTAMTVDDIAARLLKEPDDRLIDIGHQLHPFTTAGEHGRFFNGKNNCDLDNILVVLELQQLEGRKHLMRLVLLQIMYQIQQAMNRLPLDLPKLLLIDEAFGLLATDETKEFIIAWYRQLRKFGACAGVATQSINDFYSGEGAAAIMENSAHMLLLGQKSESIQMVKQLGRMPMPDAQFNLLGSVHTIKNVYSEIMIRNAFGVGIGRLIVDDYTKVVYATDAPTKEARRGYLSRGMSMHEAVMAVVEERRSQRAA